METAYGGIAKKMKTREEIITRMCYTWRHDYGLIKSKPNHNEAEGIFDILNVLEAGMTEEERHFLWRQMAQIFDNDIAPYMEFKE